MVGVGVVVNRIVLVGDVVYCEYWEVFYFVVIVGVVVEWFFVGVFVGL